MLIGKPAWKLPLRAICWWRLAVPTRDAWSRLREAPGSRMGAFIMSIALTGLPICCTESFAQETSCW